MLGVCRQVDHQNDNMEWMMSYFEAMKSQLVLEVSKQITDIVIGTFKKGYQKWTKPVSNRLFVRLNLLQRK